MARPDIIYLDNHATTAVDPRVAEAMIPYLTEHFGNPASSGHALGWFAKEAVELAREEVASLVGASPKEIVFTSGATESTNLAIIGAARANQHRGKHLITLASEHKATLDACAALESEGFETTVLPVQESGRLDLQVLLDAIREDTILVSVLMANNEIGSLQPMVEIGEICRSRGILFHADVAQATGKVEVSVGEMCADCCRSPPTRCTVQRDWSALCSSRARSCESWRRSSMEGARSGGCGPEPWPPTRSSGLESHASTRAKR